MEDAVRQFTRASHVALQPVSGGLESTVALAQVHGPAVARNLPRRFVVKQLRGRDTREADIYAQIAGRLAGAPLPAVLGVTRGPEAHYLFLEEVMAADPWPWNDLRTAALVVRELAHLHAATAGQPLSAAWDYETELARSAATTLALALEVRDAAGVRLWRRLGDLRRIVDALPAMRAQLHAGDRCWIHGDVHPGNVIVAAGAVEPRVVLIDWARARVGSPLEDVAGWLQSLGCWAPEARRRHDTLLREYLEARGWGSRASAGVRRTYWLAAACNGLSGAIRYHLAVAGDPASEPDARGRSRHALVAAERVIRRAVACLCEPMVTAAG